ncbi:MAG: MFS transporter [Candidatus Cloacimonadales bacterium]
MLKDKKIRLFAFLQMLLISMLAVTIPALITTFQQVFGLSIAQSSIIPIIGTLGGFVTNLIIAKISAHLGLKRLNQYFLLLGLTASLLLAFTGNLYLFLLGMMLIGINTAFGLTTTSTIFAHIKLQYQNYGLFHAFFGIGGIISPAIISWLLAQNYDYRYIYLFLAASYLGVLLMVSFSQLLENRKYESIKLQEAFAIIKKKFILPVLILIILQAGSEQGIVTWSGNLFQDGLGFPVESAAIFLSIYWIVFTLGRLFIHLLEKRVGKLNSVKICGVLVLSGISLLLWTGQPLFFYLIALGIAPIFPLMQKYSAQKLPEREVGLFNGMVFAAASIGNVTIAGSMGLVADFSLKISYLIPLAAAVVILLIVLHLAKLKRLGIISITPR